MEGGGEGADHKFSQNLSNSIFRNGKENFVQSTFSGAFS